MSKTRADLRRRGGTQADRRPTDRLKGGAAGASLTLTDVNKRLDNLAKLVRALERFRVVRLVDQAQDPRDPEEGGASLWLVEGSGTGDAGDLVVKINEAGTVKTITLVDYSAGGAPPAGAAGGDLAGTYPDPTLAAGVVDTAELVDESVTHAKYQHIDQNNVVGRTASGSGDPTGVAFVTVIENGMPISDSTVLLKDNLDPTKLLRIELSGITTGNTRVISMADKDVTLDDVGDSRPPNGAAGGDLGGTYPNPTLGAGVVDTVELADEAVTLAKIQHISQGSFLGRDSASSGDVEELTSAEASALLFPTADTNAIVVGGFPTRTVHISASSVTTGRTMTMPNRDITLAGDGGLTQNAVPRVDSAGDLVDGVMEDDGTTVQGCVNFITDTIASGAVALPSHTKPAIFHLELDTESSTATDDLDNVTGGVEGDLIYIRQTVASRDITIKSLAGGTGQFSMGSDIAFTNAAQNAGFLYRGAAWDQINNHP